MLSFSESVGKKICKLFSSLDIKHLDPLLFNALTDEEVMHCNVLGLLVVSRVLSKAQRAFVVAKESCLVNMKTNPINISKFWIKTTSQQASDKAMNSAS